VTTAEQATARGRPRAGEACYVYGIVPSTAVIPDGLTGVGDPAGPVSLAASRGVAAVISPVQAGQMLGTASDLRGHANVLNTVVTSSAVLPVRFGAVLASPEEVAAELLEPHHDEFAAQLGRLHGHAQFTIAGRYIGDTALREALIAEPQAMRLRDMLRGRDSEAYRQENIRLGELVAGAMDRNRLADLQVLVGMLAPHATAVSERVPSAPDSAASAAFLVPLDRQAVFEDAAEQLGRRWADRIRLRLLGPLAPYDFAELPSGV
jgi:Gas vesicle synthesis protein GvpL/GvpF